MKLIEILLCGPNPETIGDMRLTYRQRYTRESHVCSDVERAKYLVEMLLASKPDGWWIEIH